MDPDSLTGQVARRRRAQEECQRSGVVELRVVRYRAAALVLNARAAGADKDRVDADAVWAEFVRERSHQAEDRPSARSRGGAKRVAGFAGGRCRHDHASSFKRALEQRHRATREMELAVQIDSDGALPAGAVDRLDGACRPGDATVADQHVEATERALHVFKYRADVRGDRDVGHAVGDAGHFRAQAVECTAIDVADVNSGTGQVERPRDRRADTPGARGDQNAQATRRAKRIEDRHEEQSGRPAGETQCDSRTLAWTLQCEENRRA